MVQRENIDSWHPNFQLGAHSSGCCRNLGHLLIRRALSERGMGCRGQTGAAGGGGGSGGGNGSGGGGSGGGGAGGK
jgi:hypothetical protein